jgi:hypothetical protein
MIKIKIILIIIIKILKKIIIIKIKKGEKVFKEIIYYVCKNNNSNNKKIYTEHEINNYVNEIKHIYEFEYKKSFYKNFNEIRRKKLGLEFFYTDENYNNNENNNNNKLNDDILWNELIELLEMFF